MFQKSRIRKLCLHVSKSVVGSYYLPNFNQFFGFIGAPIFLCVSVPPLFRVAMITFHTDRWINWLNKVKYNPTLPMCCINVNPLFH